MLGVDRRSCSRHDRVARYFSRWEISSWGRKTVLPPCQTFSAWVSIEGTRRLEFVETPSLHPTVVSLLLQAPQPFVYIGV